MKKPIRTVAYLTRKWGDMAPAERYVAVTSVDVIVFRDGSAVRRVGASWALHDYGPVGPRPESEAFLKEHKYAQAVAACWTYSPAAGLEGSKG